MNTLFWMRHILQLQIFVKKEVKLSHLQNNFIQFQFLHALKIGQDRTECVIQVLTSQIQK
jgi:hypothetical protein